MASAPMVAAWPQRQAAEAALRAVDAVLAREPTKQAELFYRACLLDRLGRTPEARQAYFNVLAQDVGHAGALANLGALLVANGYQNAALVTYGQAVAANPDDPAGHVNLANLLREMQRAPQAQAHYEAALALDPLHPQAHQGLSYLLDGTDSARAAEHRAKGFRQASVATSPFRGEGSPVRVLHLVSARGNNIPLRAILDDRTFLTHTVVAEFAPTESLPPHDIVVNAIGDADTGEEALDAASRLIARSQCPVINQPAVVRLTTRVGNAKRLAQIPAVRTPRIELLDRSSLASVAPGRLGFPFLLRSPGFHTGQYFSRVDDAAALPALLADLPGEQILALEYLKATGPDGASRKYRAMIIDGCLYPLHLAISSHWKVHYFSADMASDPARRQEEARFLGNMADVLGQKAMQALYQVGAVVGLDYCGVDFAIADNGELLVFEANATMALAPPNADPMWDYRRPAFERARKAAQDLIVSRAAARDEG